MTGLLLVGGKGTRLRPLTYTRPKALVPLVNRPLLWYLLELLRRHGVGQAVLAVAHEHEQIEAYVASGGKGMGVTCVREEEALGTAGAIKNAAEQLGATFFVLNGDQVMDLDLGAMLEAHRKKGAVVTIAVRRVADPSQYGLVRREPDGRVLEFLEKQEQPPPDASEINAGAYVMERAVLEEIPAGEVWSSEYDLFPRLLRSGAPVYAYAQQGEWAWFDVGSAERYLAATRQLLEGRTSFELPESQAPRGWELRAPAVVDGSAEIGPDAEIGPYAVVGPGCRVGAGAKVFEAAVWEGAQVGAKAVVRGAVVGCGARIGADVTVGEGTVLSDLSRIEAWKDD